MEIRVGDKVEWTSQALGYYKTKRGTVLALIPAGKDIYDVCPEMLNVPKSRKKWADDVSKFDRALVEVPRKKAPLYYAARLAWLKRVEEDEE